MEITIQCTKTYIFLYAFSKLPQLFLQFASISTEAFYPTQNESMNQQIITDH